jgi:hypothetical protein
MSYTYVSRHQQGAALLEEIEIVGAVQDSGVVFIFHAMTPPSQKTLRGIGLIGR